MKRASTEREQKDYVLALLYRYVFGLGDLADRNFVCTNGRVYSIDEDGVPKNISFQTELRVNKAAKVKEWCTKYWDYLDPTIRKWHLVGPYAMRGQHVLDAKAAIFDV